MQNRDKPNKKLVELLWLEINRAVITSNDVKAVLANLRRLNLLDEVKEYTLALDIGKLIELTSLDKDVSPGNMLTDVAENYPEDFEEGSDIAELKDEREVSTPDTESSRIRYCIDGKPLTRNQILFQEYLDRRFDEATWLKNARIYLSGF